MNGRIRYEENFMNDGEYFIFEILSDGEWSVDSAFKLVDDRLSYTALTKIREWQNLGVDFKFV